MAYHADFWYEAISFLFKASKEVCTSIEDVNSEEKEIQLKLREEMESATEALFKRALETFMKANMLLHFAYADFEEVNFIFF